MAQTKNLCAQIPLSLHVQVCEAREAAESQAAGEAEEPDGTETVVSPCEAANPEEEAQHPEKP